MSLNLASGITWNTCPLVGVGMRMKPNAGSEEELA